MSVDRNDCFVIMPISDCEGYNTGHFLKVYEDIIKPSVENANFKPLRADEVSKTNLIQLDILSKLLEAPIAICDLSSRNPNVLFELGIRQAFDMPVLLIQEKGTPKIFDISPLRYIEYSKEMGYRDVIEVQEKITKALLETYKSKDEAGNINSIVKLLALNTAASIPTVNGDGETLKVNLLISQVGELNRKFDFLLHNAREPNNNDKVFQNEEMIKLIKNEFDSLALGYSLGNIENDRYMETLQKLKRELYRIRSTFEYAPKEYTELVRLIRKEIDDLRNR